MTETLAPVPISSLPRVATLDAGAILVATQNGQTVGITPENILLAANGIVDITPWQTGQTYLVGKLVSSADKIYRVAVDHVSGVLVDDVAAGKLVVLVDFSGIVAGAEAARDAAIVAQTAAETAEDNATIAAADAAISATDASNQALIAQNAAQVALGAANALQGTSLTSMSTTVGTKNFVTETNNAFDPGTYVLAVPTGDLAQYFSGRVTAYDTVTGAIQVEATSAASGGTFANWNIYRTGAPAPASVPYVGDSGAGGQAGGLSAPPAGSGALGWIPTALGSWQPRGSTRSFSDWSPDRSGVVDCTALLTTAETQVLAESGTRGALFFPHGLYLITGPHTQRVKYVLEEGAVILRNAATPISSQLFINQNTGGATRVDENVGIDGGMIDGQSPVFPQFNGDINDPVYKLLVPLVRYSKVLNPVFRNVRVRNFGNTAIQVDGCRNAKIINNELVGCGTNSWQSPAIREANSGSRFRVMNAALKKSATVTMTIATPAVVTWNAHGLSDGDPIIFTTTGALPTGIVAGTTYYVKSPLTNTFNVSATQGGAAINTTGSQSGVHTGTRPTTLFSDTAVPASMAGAALVLSGFRGMTTLPDGNYTGGVVGGTSLTIPTVDSSADSAFVFSGTAIVELNGVHSENSLIEGNDIRDGQRIGIEFGGYFCTVSKNNILNMREAGIFASRPWEGHILDNNISGIIVSDIDAEGITAASYYGLTVNGNYIENTEGASMLFQSGLNLRGRGNRFRNPFMTPTRVYPNNFGASSAGKVGTALPSTFRHAITFVNNSEITEGANLSDNHFVYDLDKASIQRPYQAVGLVASGGSNSVKGIQLINNNLSRWNNARRGFMIATSATDPVAGEILTSSDVPAATGLVLDVQNWGGEKFVLVVPINGNRFGLGATVTGSIAANFTTGTWDFDANMYLAGNSSTIPSQIIHSGNLNHVSRSQVLESLVVAAATTGIFKIAFGFCPSAVHIEAQNSGAPTTTQRYSRHEIVNQGASDALANYVTGTKSALDTITTTLGANGGINQRNASGVATAKVIQIIDKTGSDISLANLQAWRPYGIDINLTTNSAGLAVRFCAFP